MTTATALILVGTLLASMLLSVAIEVRAHRRGLRQLAAERATADMLGKLATVLSGATVQRRPTGDEQDPAARERAGIVAQLREVSWREDTYLGTRMLLVADEIERAPADHFQKPTGERGQAAIGPLRDDPGEGKSRGAQREESASPASPLFEEG